jgi:hypothetical protein
MKPAFANLKDGDVTPRSELSRKFEERNSDDLKDKQKDYGIEAGGTGSTTD